MVRGFKFITIGKAWQSDPSVIAECSAAVHGARKQRELAVDDGLDIAYKALSKETHFSLGRSHFLKVPQLPAI